MMSTTNKKKPSNVQCGKNQCLYTCQSEFDTKASRGSSREEKEITVNFSYVVDFELGEHNPFHLSEVLPQLESNMLDILAFNLDGCSLGGSTSNVPDDGLGSGGGDDDDWLYDINLGEGKSSSILRIRDFPHDTNDIVDATHPVCVPQTDHTTCIPIQGSINVKFAANSIVDNQVVKDQVAKVVHNYLDRGMSRDWFALPATIPKLSFIKRNETDLYTVVESSYSDDASNEVGGGYQTSNNSIGVIVCTILGVVLLAGVLLLIVKMSIIKTRNRQTKLNRATVGKKKSYRMIKSVRSGRLKKDTDLKSADFSFRDEYLDTSKDSDSERIITFEADEMDRSTDSKEVECQLTRQVQDLEDQPTILATLEQEDSFTANNLSTISEGSKESDEPNLQTNNILDDALL